MPLPEQKMGDLLDRVKRLLNPDVGHKTPLASEKNTPQLSPRDRARVHLAKRRSQADADTFTRREGPQPEWKTSQLYAHSELVNVSSIINDPDFTNFRQHTSPISLTQLQESIALEGLKVPVILVEAATPGYYHVRAGFRRTAAVQNLGWSEIPAIVLPPDTPESEEYWCNIIENTAREKLSTYELASAAQMMRDKFGVTPENFAKKSSHSPKYVDQLLACIDKLPEPILQSWANGDRIPLEILHKLSMMYPNEAVNNLRLWLGQHRLNAAETLKTLAKKQKNNKLWTTRGLERTQRLLTAIQVSKKLPEHVKKLCINVIEYCQGCRKRIDGIVDDDFRKRKIAAETTMEDDLALDKLPPPRSQD